MHEDSGSCREAETHGLDGTAGEAELGAELQADDTGGNGQHSDQEQAAPWEPGLQLLRMRTGSTGKEPQSQRAPVGFEFEMRRPLQGGNPPAGVCPVVVELVKMELGDASSLSRKRAKLKPT